jgi:excisionase family DNA binding protein
MSTSLSPAVTVPANGLNGERNSQAPPHSNGQERLLSINDVAEWLGVSKAWVYDHATRKRPFLPCVRLGELTRFRRDEIERFIQEHARINGSSR